MFSGLMGSNLFQQDLAGMANIQSLNLSRQGLAISHDISDIMLAARSDPSIITSGSILVSSAGCTASITNAVGHKKPNKLLLLLG